MVLIVDDDEGIRLLFKYMMREGGLQAVFATDLAAARRAIAQAADCALLIADHSLPDGSGLEAARLYREKFPKGKVMLSTGAVEVDGILADARAEGCAGVLRKPFDPDEALAQIQAVLAAGS
jgi:two-component system chemotaxis response regulator CheY